MVGWWYAGLGVVSLGIAGVLVVHAGVRTADRQACAAHALMAAAMAGMFWPALDVLPTLAGVIVFVLLGAWFAVVRVRRGTRGLDEPTHLAIGSAAMVVMYLGMASVSPAAGATGHAAHGGHAGTVGTGWLPAVALGLVFAGYFVWHAWETLTASRPAEEAASGRTGVLPATRTLTAAHVVLDGLMAVMFLGAL